MGSRPSQSRLRYPRNLTPRSGHAPYIFTKSSWLSNLMPLQWHFLFPFWSCGRPNELVKQLVIGQCGSLRIVGYINPALTLIHHLLETLARRDHVPPGILSERCGGSDWTMALPTQDQTLSIASRLFTHSGPTAMVLLEQSHTLPAFRSFSSASRY